jgi:hypothetical protein
LLYSFSNNDFIESPTVFFKFPQRRDEFSRNEPDSNLNGANRWALSTEEGSVEALALHGPFAKAKRPFPKEEPFSRSSSVP